MKYKIDKTFPKKTPAKTELQPALMETTPSASTFASPKSIVVTSAPFYPKRKTPEPAVTESAPKIMSLLRGAPSDLLAPHRYHRRMPVRQVAPPIKVNVDPLNEIRQLSEQIASRKWNSDLQERIDNLGNVSSSPNAYFQQTRDSSNCVKEVFKYLVLRKEILEEIEKSVASKQENLYLKDVWPGCISFITATLNNQKVCFIAVSRAAIKRNNKSSAEKTPAPDEKLLQLLDELAQDLNKGIAGRGKDNYRYAVVMDTSQTFKQMIKQLSGNTRTCAEYDFGALLSKLYSEYGQALKVEGCSNAFLFNYSKELEVKYSKGMKGATIARETVRSTYNSSVKKRSGNIELSIQGGHKATLIPCCSVCQSNKSYFIATLISFQEEGEKFRQMQRESAKLEITDFDSEEAEIEEEKVSDKDVITDVKAEVTERKAKYRLSTGMVELRKSGISMCGFLNSIGQNNKSNFEQEDSESHSIPVYNQ
ncbi:hypothetical protein Lnau_1715 [Legionella nautarum]|uniref:Uncharacterized protein n=1 Tax=Legionella nautarum TaxID=45070 RepID=A0A0W0WWN8_9GAMM|nr:hypothetical protein [Legionella nautarum]KTD36731.1 hypothetical protein Lnau_1715 [Legionella nautarum]